MRFRVLFLSILTFALCFSFIQFPAYAATDQTDPVEAAAIDVVDRGLDDLASWQLDSNLGALTLYCPIGVNSNGIVVIDNSLVNLTNSTVYFYSPQYPDYTFSAARFSPVYYRAANYSSQLLTASSVSRSSVNVVDYYDYVIPLVLLAIFLVYVWGFIKK